MDKIIAVGILGIAFIVFICSLMKAESNADDNIEEIIGNAWNDDYTDFEHF